MKVYAMMEESNGEQYGRPRRPKPETVSYLNGLPLNESVAIKQVREYVEYYQHKRSSNNGTNNEEEDAPEYPPMLSAAHAALSSIFHEFASLACEELPSQQIETLVRIACRYSLIAKRVILAGMAGYWTFLSTHRFGSHVAQTVLRCVVADCEINLDEFDDGQKECEGCMVITDSYASLGDEAVPLTLSMPLLDAINELKKFAPDLAIHVCGSHVLRTSMCVLLGAEFVDAFMPPGSTDNNTNNNSMNDWDTGALAATRRGKVKDKKLKKKKRGADEEKGNSCHEVTVVKMMKMVPELLTAEFRKDAKIAMNEMVDIVTSSDSEIDKMQPPGTIQQLTCHPSAGPLIIQILRLLCFHSSQSSKATLSRNDEITPNRRLVILPQEPCYTNGSKAEWLVHRLLCWDAKIDASGSDDGESTSAKQPYAGDIIYGLSGEPRGSVLLDTIFRCCSDYFHDTLCNIGGFYDEETLREYCQHGVSNFVVQTLLMSVRSKNQVCRMVKCLCGIVEDGSLMKVNRMGVIWRACEMCATKGSSQDQEQLLSALMRGFAATFQGEKSNDKDVEEYTRKRRSKAKGMSVEECIPRLLGLFSGSGVGEQNRLTLNAEGSRALYHILHFKERLRKDWVNGIAEIYGRDELSKIANDGLGSACVMDALLDGPARSVASKMLHQKLSDRITYLATERVGHHTVEKIFRALPTMEDKAVLSAELSHSLNKLGSNAMGRSVMVSCAVKEYCEGESVWKEAVSKQKGRESWLKEIIGEKETSDDDGDEGKKKRRKKDNKNKKKRTDSE